MAGLALWASAAPTVIYPLYAQEWQLSPSVTTLIFAVYPVALVPVLIVFGGLSDFIGRRATILIGLAALGAGSVVFGLAPDLAWVLVGRALMGIGVGLSLSPATAAMVEFGGRDGARRASSATTAATATGLALSTIIGGALVQYAPAPMRLSFWVLTGVTLIVGGLALLLPRHTRDESAGAWRPRLPSLPRTGRGAFVAGTLGISAAYTMGAIFLALGAQIARELVKSDNAFVDGAIISLSAVAIGVVAVLTRPMPARRSVTIGHVLALVGLGLLVIAGLTQSLPVFVASSLIAGSGYSLMFSGGLGLITASAPVHHRAGVISTAYIIGYLVQAAAALGLGMIATSAGLELALELGAPAVVLLGVGALVIANVNASTPAPAAVPA